MNLLDRILKHREEQGYQYGSLWPTRYKVDSKGNTVHGSLEFDPGAGALGATVRAAHELATVPGEVASGQRPLTQDLGPRLAGDMFALGRPGPSDSLGIFGSYEAKTFPKVNNLALREATQMTSVGEKPEEIFHKTGLFQGGDGNWRFEIPDAGAKLNKSAFIPAQAGNGKYYVPGIGTSLGQVLNHPKLYEAYPDLANIQVKPVSSTGALNYSGQYSPIHDTMTLLGVQEPELLKTALHETQHAIDTREGFQAGANPDMYVPSSIKHMMSELPGEAADLQKNMKGYDLPMLLNALYKDDQGIELNPHEEYLMQSAGHEPWIGDLMNHYYNRQAVNAAMKAANQSYTRTGGEVMARNVENRLTAYQPNLYPKQPFFVRSDNGLKLLSPNDAFLRLEGLPAPNLTEDVPRGQQIWSPRISNPPRDW